MPPGSDGESNPIYRGVWPANAPADPPPPPPRRAAFEKKDDAKLSLKEQIALHRENAACARRYQDRSVGIALEA